MWAFPFRYSSMRMHVEMPHTNIQRHQLNEWISFGFDFLSFFPDSHICTLYGELCYHDCGIFSVRCMHVCLVINLKFSNDHTCACLYACISAQWMWWFARMLSYVYIFTTPLNFHRVYMYTTTFHSRNRYTSEIDDSMSILVVCAISFVLGAGGACDPIPRNMNFPKNSKITHVIDVMYVCVFKCARSQTQKANDVDERENEAEKKCRWFSFARNSVEITVLIHTYTDTQTSARSRTIVYKSRSNVDVWVACRMTSALSLHI